MAQPHKAFPSEPGAQICGDTWWTRKRVTGELPNMDGFGADMNVTIEPVFSVSEYDTFANGKLPGDFGRNGNLEVQLRESLRDRIADIDDWREMYSEDLSGKDQQSLRWLLDRATYQLDKVNDLYDKWTYREGGSWALHLGDTTASFPQRHLCGPQPEGGLNSGFVRAICPRSFETKARKDDRKEIRKLILGALRNTRCAEYWMHRVRLQTQAMRALDELPPDQRPAPTRTQDPSCVDRATRQFITQGLSAAQARQRAEQSCAPRPFIGILIDPDLLPPFDSDDDDDRPDGSDGSGWEGHGQDGGEEKSSNGLLIAGGIAAAVLLLPRLLR